LAVGAEVNSPTKDPDEDDSTPPQSALDLAGLKGHDNVVRLLLARGSTQELQCYGGFTALHYAVFGNCPGVVALLCTGPGATAALALKTRANNRHPTPLAHAIHYGYAACEAGLRAHGAPE
jgi:ankyrin repeat protein